MRTRWGRHALALAVFAITTVAAPVARGDGDPALVIEVAPLSGFVINSVPSDATPAEAAEQVAGLALMPGSHAIWREGVGIILILDRTAVQGGEVPDFSSVAGVEEPASSY